MKEGLPGIAKEALRDYLHVPGGILYSSHETLKPGALYLLGLNPGGEGGTSLGNVIDGMLSASKNEYLDECWENKNGRWSKGEAPLQKRIIFLLEYLGFEPRNVCAGNLAFIKTRSAAMLTQGMIDACWPVQEAILEIVKPKMILAFGNSDVSPYGYLMRRLRGVEVKPARAGHGNWLIKSFTGTINGRDIRVVGIPHLSRYQPEGKTEALSFIFRGIHGDSRPEYA